jgi:hypothetical protein
MDTHAQSLHPAQESTNIIHSNGILSQAHSEDQVESDNLSGDSYPVIVRITRVSKAIQVGSVIYVPHLLQSIQVQKVIRLGRRFIIFKGNSRDTPPQDVYIIVPSAWTQLPTLSTIKWYIYVYTLAFLELLYRRSIEEA